MFIKGVTPHLKEDGTDRRNADLLHKEPIKWFTTGKHAYMLIYKLGKQIPKMSPNFSLFSDLLNKFVIIAEWYVGIKPEDN